MCNGNGNLGDQVKVFIILTLPPQLPATFPSAIFLVVISVFGLRPFSVVLLPL